MDNDRRDTVAKRHRRHHRNQGAPGGYHQGGWKQAAKLDGKSHLAILGVADTTISADITVSTQGETWMNSQIVINGQNNDTNGANNNIGWRATAHTGPDA